MNDHATPLPEPPPTLAGRDFLRARDLSRIELDSLLALGMGLKAAQKARVTEAAREEKAALKAAERQQRAEQAALAQAQREMLREQQRMAREELAARERAQRAMVRNTTGRSRSSSAEDPGTTMIRSVFGTLFGK